MHLTIMFLICTGIFLRLIQLEPATGIICDLLSPKRRLYCTTGHCCPYSENKIGCAATS